jgi:hypothetical protein
MPDLETIEKSDSYEPQIVRLRYGSPFEVIARLSDPILGGAVAMSVVIYGIKRLWKLPTELRTHSADVEAEYLIAQTFAIEALERRDLVRDRYNASTRKARATMDALFTRMGGVRAI